MKHVRILLAALVPLWFVSPVSAQQPSEDWIFGNNGEDLVLELGGGIALQPAYEGADAYDIEPWPIIRPRFVRIPRIGTFGGDSKDGFSFRPSFRFVDERDASDYSDLTGLNDVDWAFEAGATIGYRHGLLSGFATMRQGFGGHDGLVAELGLDANLELTPELEVSFGPRVHLASDDYLDTYFGVSAAESAASGYPVFDPDGWLKGAGFEAKGRYALTRHWAIRGEAGYERLLGDAADSPITGAGSENQFHAALGLTYTFGLNLFD